MVTFELNETSTLTNTELLQLAQAKCMPIIYDDDSPELTGEMERAFAAARKAKPFRGEEITLNVSPDTLEKAKAMGPDYLTILSRLLDKAVDEYPAIS